MLVLRQTKGSALTIAEEDGNFVYLQELYEVLVSAGYLPKAGAVEMEGNFNANSYGIINLFKISDPSSNDVVTILDRKFYDSNGILLLDLGDVNNGTGILNLAGFTTFLKGLASSNRTATFPDKDITVAGIDDIVAAIIDTAYGGVWDGDTTHTASRNALYDKLSSLDAQITALSLYLGKYISLVALQTAYPTSTSGHWAIVDPGSGTNAVEYIWDDNEGWVIGSGSSGVASVFGRTGVITAMIGDYTTAQITEVTNLFFTVARVYLSAISSWTPSAGVIANGDTLQQVLQKLSGNIAAISSSSTYISTQSGVIGTTVFNIAHGLAGTPTYIAAFANSADAVGSFYTSADATNIIISYSIAPPAGTNNLKFSATAKL